MKIEYNIEKSAKNEADRGLSFNDVVHLDWNQRLYQTKQDIGKDHGESRYIAFASWNKRLYVVCFTWRKTTMRVISFRKASKREESRYAKKTTH